MKIHTRLALWYCSLLVLGMLLIMGWTYYEFFVEHPQVIEAMRAQGNPPMEEIGEIFLFGGLPALLLALIGGWFLMRRALSPLTRLRERVEATQAENLHQSLPLSGNGDELDRLTMLFNQMTSRLGDSFQRVREFSLHASHELKTPLTLIRHELDTALHDDKLSGSERERCASLLEEIERLTQIVDGLNFLTKADAGMLSLEKLPVQLDELVQDACDDAQALAQAGNIKVQLEECARPTVTGDRRRLRQLLLILTDNAIKYNLPDGTVNIALTQNPTEACLAVRNTGPAIACEALPRVFDRFYRGDASHNHQIEGCGLGLTIARGIVQAHGGKIEINSRPGDWTTVTVHLPLSGGQGFKRPEPDSAPTGALLIQPT